jgi:hypothetical protein
VSDEVKVPVDEPVPDWASSYNAKDYPRQSVTGDAVALALDTTGPHCTVRALLVERGGEPYKGLDAWPGGFMDWEGDADTRQAAIRELREETGVEAPEFVEALGSYSRNGRDPRQFAGYRDERSGEWIARGSRVTTAAYLMLTHGAAEPAGADDAVRAHWADVYAYLPWEDLRDDAGGRSHAVASALREWAGEDAGRQARVGDLFGLAEWNEERTAERWALLMEARLVPEARRDRWGRVGEGADAEFGREMAFDHREILADALGRIRGKIKYTPAALMALTGREATLDELQGACEAIAGRPLHRSNFRRAVAPSGRGKSRAPRLVARTGRRRPRAGRGPGVAPEVYRFLPDAVRARLDTSIRFPWLPLA